MNTETVAVSRTGSKTNLNFGTWGWAMIIFSMVMYFNVAGWCADGLNIFTTAFGERHGWDPSKLLTLATPGGLIGVAGSIIFGQIIVKKGTRFVITLCLALAALSIICFGRITTLTEFAIAYAFISFFSVGFFIAPNVLITSWFPSKKGFVLGITTIGLPAATALFVPLIAFMFSAFGIPNATTIYGIIMIVLAVIAFFLVKDFPEQVGCFPDNEKIPDEEVQQNLKEMESYVSPFTLRILLKDREMWLISLGFGCLWMVTVGIVVQMVPRLMEIGFEQNKAIIFLSLAALCAVPGSLIWGWLDQRLGTRSASMIYALWYILALIMLIVQTSNTVITFLTVVSVGIGIGGIGNLIASVVGTVYGRWDYAAANRIIFPILGSVRTLCFPVIGAALALTKSYSGAYAVFIAVNVIGLILIFFIRPECKGKKG